MNDLPIIEGLIITAAVITASTVIIVAFIKSGKFIKKIIHFFDDFLGEEERPGVPARPGFSERMNKLEGCISKVDERLNLIEYQVKSIDKELQPNSGLSMRDAINRIEKRLATLENSSE
jgi:hypothetical protein